jgi:hypothetical protein
LSSDDGDEILVQAFAKLDKIGFGIALGTVFGLAIFSATMILVLKGGDGPIGPTLSLLGQFYIGYTVTAAGSLIGLFYGFLTGFLLGFLFAVVRNATLLLYAVGARAKQELTSLDDFLDHM